MDKEIAKVAGQFLLRADLKGSEVPAFNAVMEALEAIIRGDVVCQKQMTPKT